MGKINILEKTSERKAKDCLDDNVIAAYAAKTLSAKDKKAAEAHFAVCTRCRREALELFEFMKDTGEKEDISAKTLQKTMDLIKRKINKTTVICPKCGFENDGDANFCGNCRYILSDVIVLCKYCRHEIVPGQNYCTNCGRPVIGNDEVII